MCKLFWDDSKLKECNTKLAQCENNFRTCHELTLRQAEEIVQLEGNISSKESTIVSLTSQNITLSNQNAALKVALEQCQGGLPIPNVPPRVDCGIIDPNPIYTLIKNRWGIGIFEKGRIIASSGQYKVTTIDSLMEYVRYAKVHQTAYIPTFHDCPDFSYALLGQFCNEPKWWGTAFGTITLMGDSGWHRLNVAFCYPSASNRTLTMYLIEPQSATIVDAAYQGRNCDLVLLP